MRARVVRRLSWASGFGFLTALGGCGDDALSVTVISPLDADVLAWAEGAFEEANPGLDLRWVPTPSDATLDALRGRAGAAVWGAPSWILAEAAREGLLDESLDGAGPWLPSVADPLVLGFNPDSLARSRAPRDWIDLLHPRWVGRMAWPDATASESGAVLLATLVAREEADTGDPQAGFDWLANVDRNLRDYAPDDREIARRLHAGFAIVAPLPLSVAVRSRAQGRSLDFRIPESPTPVIVRGLGLRPGATRAASAFVDWIGRPEQLQALAERFALMPIDLGMVQAVPGSALAAMTAGLRYATIPADTLAEHLDAWVERWRTTVQGRAPRVF